MCSSSLLDTRLLLLLDPGSPGTEGTGSGLSKSRSLTAVEVEVEVAIEQLVKEVKSHP